MRAVPDSAAPAAQTAVVAPAVHPLVMVGGVVGERAEHRDALEERQRVGRVLLDDGALAGVEAGRLVEDRVRDGELADVVEERGAAEAHRVDGAIAEPIVDGQGVVRDPGRVLEGVGDWRG